MIAAIISLSDNDPIRIKYEGTFHLWFTSYLILFFIKYTAPESSWQVPARGGREQRALEQEAAPKQGAAPL